MKKKMIKKFVSGVTVMSLILASVPFNLYAATDTTGHWAKTYMDKLVSEKVLTGDPSGALRPDKAITRAEFITLMNKVFGYVDKNDNTFTDVSSTDWFLGEMQKATKAGYIAGYTDGTAKPNGAITRQEAAFAMWKAFGLTAGSSDTLKKFKDGGSIQDYARDAVASLVEHNAIAGYPEGNFKPAGTITRAEASTILARFADVYSTAGTFGTASGVTTAGNVVINTPDVVLSGMTINGDLYIAPGVAEGDATLNNVVVKGTTYVQGGGVNSIKLIDSSIKDVKVKKINNKPVRIVAQGKTDVGTVNVGSSAKLVESSLNVSNQGFNAVQVAKTVDGAMSAILDGKFTNVNMASSGDFQLLSGSVNSMQVSIGLIVTMKTNSGAVISNLQTSSPITLNGAAVSSNSTVAVSGTGTVSTVSGSTNGSYSGGGGGSTGGGSTGGTSTGTSQLSVLNVAIGAGGDEITFYCPTNGLSVSVGSLGTITQGQSGVPGYISFTSSAGVYTVHLADTLAANVSVPIVVSKSGMTSFKGTATWVRQVGVKFDTSIKPVGAANGGVTTTVKYSMADAASAAIGATYTSAVKVNVGQTIWYYVLAKDSANSVFTTSGAYTAVDGAVASGVVVPIETYSAAVAPTPTGGAAADTPTTFTVTFNDFLDTTKALNKADFTLAGSDVGALTISNVGFVAGAAEQIKVTVTGGTLALGKTYTIAYKQPTTPTLVGVNTVAVADISAMPVNVTGLSAPVLTGGLVASSGTAITVTFDKDLVAGTYAAGQFVLSGSGIGAQASIASATVPTTNLKTVVLTLAGDAITSGALNISVVYKGASQKLVGKNGVVVADWDKVAGAVNADGLPTAILNSQVATAGTQIILTMSNAVDFSRANASNFKVTETGKTFGVQTAVVSGAAATQIVLTITGTKITAADTTLIVTYTPSTAYLMTASKNAKVASFSGTVNTAGLVAPVKQSVAVSSGTGITIAYDAPLVVGTYTVGQFKLSGSDAAKLTINKAEVLASNPNNVVLTLTGDAITPSAVIAMSYVAGSTNNLVGTSGELCADIGTVVSPVPVTNSLTAPTFGSASGSTPLEIKLVMSAAVNLAKIDKSLFAVADSARTLVVSAVKADPTDNKNVILTLTGATGMAGTDTVTLNYTPTAVNYIASGTNGMKVAGFASPQTVTVSATLAPAALSTPLEISSGTAITLTFDTDLAVGKYTGSQFTFTGASPSLHVDYAEVSSSALKKLVLNLKDDAVTAGSMTIGVKYTSNQSLAPLKGANQVLVADWLAGACSVTGNLSTVTLTGVAASATQIKLTASAAVDLAHADGTMFTITHTDSLGATKNTVVGGVTKGSATGEILLALTGDALANGATVSVAYAPTATGKYLAVLSNGAKVAAIPTTSVNMAGLTSVAVNSRIATSGTAITVTFADDLTPVADSPAVRAQFAVAIGAVPATVKKAEVLVGTPTKLVITLDGDPITKGAIGVTVAYTADSVTPANNLTGATNHLKVTNWAAGVGSVDTNTTLVDLTTGTVPTAAVTDDGGSVTITMAASVQGSLALSPDQFAVTGTGSSSGDTYTVESVSVSGAEVKLTLSGDDDQIAVGDSLSVTYTPALGTYPALGKYLVALPTGSLVKTFTVASVTNSLT